MYRYLSVILLAASLFTGGGAKAQAKMPWPIVSYNFVGWDNHPQITDNGRSRYWIVRSNNYEFKMDTINVIKFMDPVWLSEVDIPENASVKAKYGVKPNTELVILTLNDDKFPEAVLDLLEHMIIISDDEDLPQEPRFAAVE